MSERTLSNVELTHRGALGSAKPLVAERIRLTPLPEGTVLLAMGSTEAAGSLGNAAARAGLSLRASGPGQWYLVGDERMSPAAVQDLARSLDGFTLIDQSHGRVRIAVEGPVVEDLLAKGTGMDLALFEIGESTGTLVGHIATHITRTASNRFELMPPRGFAESLWHDLEIMATEYSDIIHSVNAS